jgi:hypothetical protein
MSLDQEKLKHNAITSIRLGVEDFQRCKDAAKDGGDPGRALSAVRNLYSGILLLLKYRLYLMAPQSGDELIYKTEGFTPALSSSGEIRWRPRLSKRVTIEVEDIKGRLNGLGISLNWSSLDALRNERNNIEHKHSDNAISTVSEFVAAVFPFLRDLVILELNTTPASLLGGETWAAMLANHELYQEERAKCLATWEGVLIPPKMRPYFEKMTCHNCGSALLSKTGDQHVDAAICTVCDWEDAAMNMLEDTLLEALDDGDLYSDDCPVQECPACERKTFVVKDAICYWCETPQRYLGCKACDTGLTLDQQDLEGFCPDCYRKWTRD